MAGNFDARIHRLKTRRTGINQITTAETLPENTQTQVYNTQQQETWERRAVGDKATCYALGAMQEIDPEYTRSSIETGERTGRQITQNLEANGLTTVFRLHGCLPLNTHINGLSDLDILVIDEQVLMVARAGIKYNSYPSSNKEGLDVLYALRKKIEQCLPAVFPAEKVHTDNVTSVKVTGEALAREINVMPAIWWDTVSYQQTSDEKKRGVAVFNKQIPKRVYATPFLHINLIELRCNQSHGGLRKSVRLLNNIKADAENEGSRIALSSFEIASIMYHADINALSQGRSFELAILSETQRWLNWLCNNYEEAKKLDTPDGTRKIFDKEEKQSQLLMLSSQVDTLMRAVAIELNDTFKDNTPLHEIRQYLATSPC